MNGCTLVTFLGRPPREENGRYQRTVYEFPDGERTEPVAFFGWVLRERLQPGRLVVLGTAGSIWDHLFESDLDLGGTGEQERVVLMEDVEHHAVTQAQLDRTAPLLEKVLGIPARLRIIPYCRTEAEQVELLRILADEVRPDDRVHLDVSHGFRHLPMLVLLAALYLEVVRGIRVAGIWYGAYNPDTGKAPVHDLSGLLGIARWLQALQTYDKDGDYGVLCPLLGEAGGLLRQAAFFERTTNPVKAREALTGWMSRADRLSAGDPAADLFRDELERRIDWYRGADRAAWEDALAERYLEKGDYLRAAVYGLEANISREVLRIKEDVNNYDCRQNASSVLQGDGSFRRLKHLRNAMAHGVLGGDPVIKKIIGDEVNLRNTLKSLLKTLREQSR